MKLIKKKKMKTINLFCKSVVILLFAGFTMNTVAARTTKKETVTKVYSITPSGNLDIVSSFGTNIEILTWGRNEVKVLSELTYEEGNNKDDIDKLLNAFKNMSAESSGNVLKLNLTLIKSSIQVGAFRLSKTTTILYNDEKTSLDGNKIKTTYTIWIPENLNIKIDSKFGKLKIASIKGNVDVSLSNNDMEMGDFGASGIFNTRFSTLTVGSGGTSKFDVNNGNVNAAELKNVTINARFSNFEIAKAHDVSMEINNGTAVFGMLNDINATARFSTIRIESNAGKSKFDFNNSNLFGKNFQTMEISARFSTIRIENIADKSKFDFHNSTLFGKNFQTMEISTAKFSKFNVTIIDNLKINSSHNSNFDFNTVNTFMCRESRFSTFEFDEIVVEASFPNTHNSDIFVNRTSTSFTGFSGNFRFGTINLKINPSVEYNLNYEGTFGQLNTISSDKFKTRLVSEKSGSKTTIQGVNAGAKCNIEIVANNTNCRIE